MVFLLVNKHSPAPVLACKLGCFQGTNMHSPHQPHTAGGAGPILKEEETQQSGWMYLVGH